MINPTFFTRDTMGYLPNCRGNVQLIPEAAAPEIFGGTGSQLRVTAGYLESLGTLNIIYIYSVYIYIHSMCIYIYIYTVYIIYIYIHI